MHPTRTIPALASSGLALTGLALTGLVLASFAFPAAAQDAPRWTVDPAASTLGFTALLQGAAVESRFARFDADIALDPASPEAGAITITVDIASATSENPQASGAMLSPDWLAADSFGQAVFRSDSITGADGSYVAEGTLTIRDQTVPVSLPFTLAVDGDTAEAEGTITLDRTSFGVGQGSWAKAEPVAHEVEVSFDITASTD